MAKVEVGRTLREQSYLAVRYRVRLPCAEGEVTSNSVWELDPDTNSSIL